MTRIVADITIRGLGVALAFNGLVFLLVLLFN